METLKFAAFCDTIISSQELFSACVVSTVHAQYLIKCKCGGKSSSHLLDRLLMGNIDFYREVKLVIVGQVGDVLVGRIRRPTELDHADAGTAGRTILSQYSLECI